MRRSTKGRLVALGAVALVLLGTGAPASARRSKAVAEFVDSTGQKAGKVEFLQYAKFVQVTAHAYRLTNGFHGFHIHEFGKCSGSPSFADAGGHFNPAGQSHPGHAGDMPVLFVVENYGATSRFVTDRFRVDDLLDADGSALIVHAKPDNYANIPADRYGKPADETTLKTGDAGGRDLCAVVKRTK